MSKSVRSSAAGVMVEGLEARRMMAGHPALGIPVPGFVTGPTADGGAPSLRVASTHKRHTTAAPATTNLVGDWSGKITARVLFIRKSFKTSFHITAQTATTITGSITVKGHTVSGTFNATVNADGSIKFSLKARKVSVKVDGWLDGSGNVVEGNASLSYHGFSVKGTFKFTRQ